MSRRGRALADDELALPAVDPTTGDLLAPVAATLRLPSTSRRTPRGRRRRRIAIALLVASVVHVLLAITAERRVDAVRALDRLWANAVALDDARVALSEDVADQPLHVRRELVEPVVSESRARIGDVLDEIRATAVPGAVRDLKREIVDTLEVHSALLLRVRTAIPIATTGRADEALASARKRLLLTAAEAPPVELVTLTNARNKLARFATDHTDAALVAALRDGRLAVIDVDASTITYRDGPAGDGAVRKIVGADGFAVVLTATKATAIPLDDAPVLWSVPATDVVGQGDSGRVWVLDGRSFASHGSEPGVASRPLRLADDEELIGEVYGTLAVRTRGGGVVQYDAFEAGIELIASVFDDDWHGPVVPRLAADGALEWFELFTNRVVDRDELGLVPGAAHLIGAGQAVMRGPNGEVFLRSADAPPHDAEGPAAAVVASFALTIKNDRLFYVDMAGRVQHFLTYGDRRVEPLRMPKLDIVAMDAARN